MDGVHDIRKLGIYDPEMRADGERAERIYDAILSVLDDSQIPI